MQDGTATPQGSNTIARRDFGGSEMERRAETAATAAAAQVRAAMEFHYVKAMRDPRDWDDVRLRLLRECDRPVFAREAYYHKPIGEGVTGLSIRFAEKALTCMRNVASDTIVTFDDEEKRIVRQVITDYENNVTFAKDIVIAKTVERRTTKEGQEILGSRLNSKNQLVYLVRATEDDLLNKEGALVSKAMRTNVLRILPGDIQHDCEQKIKEKLAAADQVDPEGRKKAMLADFYEKLGVKPQQLAEVLGHSLEAPLSPPEFAQLRGLFNAIRDGETNITAAIDNAIELRGDAKKPAAAETTTTTEPKAAGPAGRVKEKLKKQDKTPTPAPPPTEQAPPTEDRPGTIDAKSEAAKIQNALLELAAGNMAEAEIALSSATGGKIQKFADLVAALEKQPGWLEMIGVYVERHTAGPEQQ